mmetsp:Transcript_52071/g.86808  ORF Transcript_52071/g.86808 Transcript_52071/m.86808 type:complete len:226 (+) Transcript_52071:305-982(+)
MVVHELQLPDRVPVPEAAHVHDGPVTIAAPHLHFPFQNDMHPLRVIPKPQDAVPGAIVGRLQGICQDQSVILRQGLEQFHALQELLIQRPFLCVQLFGLPTVHLPIHYPELAFSRCLDSGPAFCVVHQLQLPEKPAGAKAGQLLPVPEDLHSAHFNDIQLRIFGPLLQHHLRLPCRLTRHCGHHGVQVGLLQVAEQGIGRKYVTQALERVVGLMVRRGRRKGVTI